MYPNRSKARSWRAFLRQAAIENKYDMGKKILNETIEEKRLRLRAAYDRWIAKPENRLAKRASDKRSRLVHLEKVKEQQRQWRINNKDKTRLKSANERAARLQRSPAWSDQNAVKEFYLNCPAGMQIDHIIPLNGKIVSGLHVVDNLQYLAVADNILKSNKFEN